MPRLDFVAGITIIHDRMGVEKKNWERISGISDRKKTNDNKGNETRSSRAVQQ